MKRFFLLSLIALTAFAQTAWAVDKAFESKSETFRVKTYVSGLEHPWSIAFLPGGDALVSERDGRLRLIRDGKLLKQPISGLPEIASGGQGGLLDIALHPDFSDNQLVYFSYSAEEDGLFGTQVARGTLAESQLTGVEIIFKAQPKTSTRMHFGSRLLFLPDGTLLVSLGDKYHRMEDAQDLSNHLGTVVRIRDDGTIPEDNPFIGRENAEPTIYTYGHRNIQGMALRGEPNEPWIHEHGPQGGDELNRLEPGANYGWPEITYGIDYDGSIISRKTRQLGMVQPMTYWSPSIAPSGMVFYEGDAFANWQGNIFLGALAGQHLRRVVLNGNTVIGEEKLLESLNARIRDVEVGPDGALYVLTDSDQGEVWRISPEGGI